MGLLDEAIRDHLELKRRRGADPSEIARAEREALEPVFPDEPRPAALDGEPRAVLSDDAPPQGDPLAEAAASDPEEPPSQPGGAPGLSSLGQETAELDMEAVLEQDAPLGAGDDAAPSAVAPVRAEAAAEDEPLEWEMPGRSAEPPPEPLPGQERLSFE
ncbi:MAG: hypothetical protein JWM60_2760 [Solirubrobacterales bacterium]|nr:hypothetical protein [Solirubrobacterales bacterium]